MKAASRGFTIFEVMLVLSVSSILLFAAVTMFQGRRESTEFTQAMYDLQSKFQSYANQVATSSVPGFNDYTCSQQGESPELAANTSGTDKSSGECILLGLALQVPKDGDTIYSFPVLGLQANDPTTPKDAKATPAKDDKKNYVLDEQYPILNGLTIKSTKLGSSDEYDFLTLYASLTSSSNASGNEIEASTSQATFKTDEIKSKKLEDCIQQNVDTSQLDNGAGNASNNKCGPPVVLNNTPWNLCITNGSRDAELSLRPTATGITTKLNMNGCT